MNVYKVPKSLYLLEIVRLFAYSSIVKFLGTKEWKRGGKTVDTLG